MKIGNWDFNEAYAIDFEFQASPGEIPKPICLVVLALGTGVVSRFWQDDLQKMKQAPFPIDSSAVTVAYYASAEMGCFIQLGWELPTNILDLFTEFRCLTNNQLSTGHGLLDALSWLGIDGIGFSEKEEMRSLAMRGGPYTESEKTMLLDYCETDVIALQKIFSKLHHKLDAPRALLRGRYMKAAAKMESDGIPIDTEMLEKIESNWPDIQTHLIRRVDVDFGVFEGLTFKTNLFAEYLVKNQIAWPTLPSGKLDFKETTFEEMAKVHPSIAPLHELRVSLSQMRSGFLPVGQDGCNRTILSAFRSVTGRNQPKTTSFIFGRSAWVRHLIQPKPQMALASIDWSQQEFGIAGALSGDAAMISAYNSGDPYLEFGKQAGVIPAYGTKKSHGREREQFKQCALAVLYGGSASLISTRTGLSVFESKELIRAHKKSYPMFWKWIGAAVDRVNMGETLQTVFGWPYRHSPRTKLGTILNFPMQANGAEMMRLAAIYLTEAGITVCAPIHDAFLIGAPVEKINEAVAHAQSLMAKASELVLGGNLILRSEVKVFTYPDRYMDERGTKMWATVQEILQEIERTKPTHERELGVRTNAQGLPDCCVPVQSTYLSPFLDNLCL